MMKLIERALLWVNSLPLAVMVYVAVKRNVRSIHRFQSKKALALERKLTHLISGIIALGKADVLF